MTNQPTNNGWIIDAAKEIYNEVVCEDWENTTDPKNAIKKIILDNLPNPTEVVAPVEIVNALIDMRNQYCGDIGHCCMSAGENCLGLLEDLGVVEEGKYDRGGLIDNIQHLKGTTPVEPINQERVSAIKKKYKKRLTTDSIDVNYVIYKQVYNEFLDDITSLQSSEEKVEGE